MMMVLRLLFVSVVPRFEDYPVNEVFRGKPALPILEKPEERKFEGTIGDGVSEGWGVYRPPSPAPSVVGRKAVGCGAHYYLMDVDGSTLIRRIVSDEPLSH
jgi:hypothetical protein